MGRPKRSDLFCTTCSLAFSKKLDLQLHMKSHSDSKKGKDSDERQTRVHSNWCAACKKSFDDNEYKLHIQTEHQLDIHKTSTDDSDNEHFPYKSGFVLLSRKKIKTEPETEDPILHSDIKIEPMSEEESGSSSPKKAIEKIKKTRYVTCPDCGAKCKNAQGLKIHKLSMHKRRRKSSNIVSDSTDSEEDVDDPTDMEINSSDNNYNPMPLGNMDALNTNQNLSGLFNVYVPSNVIGAENNTNDQVPPTSANEPIKILELIPPFDCETEKYTKWLKHFIQKCKRQTYPLPDYMCDNINHIQCEIASALHMQPGSLSKKSCHFYFMKMHKILNDILLGHMRHKMSFPQK